MLSNLIWLHMLPNKVRQHSIICRLQSAGVQLSSEAVQGPSLPFQSIHHIHGGHSLPFGVLSVGDAITPCKAPNRRLSDALDVVPQNLAMSLGTSLAQSFSSFASSSHGGKIQLLKL